MREERLLAIQNVCVVLAFIGFVLMTGLNRFTIVLASILLIVGFVGIAITEHLLNKEDGEFAEVDRRKKANKKDVA